MFVAEVAAKTHTFSRHPFETPQPFSHDCCFNCSELELKEVLAYFILFSSPKHQSFALRRAQ